MRKYDALLGTILAALAGLCFAQLPVFIQQYLQRLGGHVDEAHLSLVQIMTNASVRTRSIDAEGTLLETLPRGFYLRTQFTRAILQAHYALSR